MQFISKTAAIDTNIEISTLWIPKTAFPASLHGLDK